MVVIVTVLPGYQKKLVNTAPTRQYYALYLHIQVTFQLLSVQTDSSLTLLTSVVAIFPETGHCATI